MIDDCLSGVTSDDKKLIKKALKKDGSKISDKNKKKVLKILNQQKVKFRKKMANASTEEKREQWQGKVK